MQLVLTLEQFFSHTKKKSIFFGKNKVILYIIVNYMNLVFWNLIFLIEYIPFYAMQY